MAVPKSILPRPNNQNQSRSDIINISADAEKRLVEYARHAYLQQNDVWNLRSRLERVDRNNMRQLDLTEETRKAQAAQLGGDPTKLQNIIVPIVSESVNTGVSFLSQVFLSDYPMFKFGSGPESEDVALMWNTLVGEDQLHYGWAAEFNKAFRNAEKYNFSPIECDWTTEKLYKPQNGNGPNGVVMEQVMWEGNKIASINPYNFIYDTRCNIDKLHIDGEFAGYLELMSRTKLKRFLHSLGEDRLKNDVRAYEAPNWDMEYYIPQINPKVLTRANYGMDGAFNWVAWVTNEAQNKIKYRNVYTVLKLYARLMPYEFGIRSPMDQTPDTWKLIIVNGVLVYARPLTNAHDYLPIVVVQSQSDNLDVQTESNAEAQEPFQQMISALWNAKLQSARRRVTDRALYNPLLIEPDHINSPNPSAKIPVKPAAYGRPLAEALYQIPFHDENSQYWLQEVQGLSEWSLRSQGHNRVSQGQFQKGNKLQSEFQTVMANAGAQDRTKAIMWEVNGMYPLKTMLKSNYLQFIGATTRYNRKEQKTVQIDPTQLRQTAAEFEVGDGLLPIEKLLGTDVLTQALQFLQSNPQVAQDMDVAGAVTYLLKVAGADKIDKFKKDPQTVQYEQALGIWKQQSTMLIELLVKNPNADPKAVSDAVAKSLGPMPKPPGQQQQGQQQPQQGAQNAPTPA